jgi:hypothetical protein
VRWSLHPDRRAPEREHTCAPLTMVLSGRLAVNFLLVVVVVVVVVVILVVYTQSYQNPALCLEQAPLRPPTGTRSSPTRTTSTNTGCERFDQVASTRKQLRSLPSCTQRSPVSLHSLSQEPGRVYTQSYQNPALCLEQAPLRPPTGTRSSPTPSDSTKSRRRGSSCGASPRALNALLSLYTRLVITPHPLGVNTQCWSARWLSDATSESKRAVYSGCFAHWICLPACSRSSRRSTTAQTNTACSHPKGPARAGSSPTSHRFGSCFRFCVLMRLARQFTPEGGGDGGLNWLILRPLFCLRSSSLNSRVMQK